MGDSNLNKRHEDLMKLLYSVPEVEEHMNRFEVKSSTKLLKKRIELGLEQSELAELLRDSGLYITKETINRMENADLDIDVRLYRKLLDTLHEIENGYLEEN